MAEKRGAAIPRAKAALGGVFYGWWLVVAGALIHSVGHGLVYSGFTVFFLPIKRELDLSSAAVSLVFGAARLEGGAEGPVVGYLINKFGPRKVILGGTAFTAVGFFLLSRIDSFLAFFLVYVMVITLGYSAGFYSPISTAVNNWFIRRRGTAFGLLGAAGNMGAVVLVPLLSYVVLSQGWRTAAVLSGIIILVVSVPMAMVFVNTPESRGLRPDGGPPGSRGDGSREAREAVGDVDYTVRQALKTRHYWLLTVCVCLRIMVTIALAAHLVPILVWRGMSESGAAWLVGLSSLVTIPAMLVIGRVGDRVSKAFLCSLSMLITVACLAIPIFFSSGFTLYLIPVGLALVMASAPQNWSIIGDFFGRRSYASLRGIMLVGTGIVTFISPVYAGWVYDTTGSYMGVLITFAVLMLLTSGLFAILKKPGPPPPVRSQP